jgi:hypothetical protein
LPVILGGTNPTTTAPLEQQKHSASAEPQPLPIAKPLQAQSEKQLPIGPTLPTVPTVKLPPQPQLPTIEPPPSHLNSTSQRHRRSFREIEKPVNYKKQEVVVYNASEQPHWIQNLMQRYALTSGSVFRLLKCLFVCFSSLCSLLVVWFC